ncbi:response regulator [Chloroflexota bacterium]
MVASFIKLTNLCFKTYYITVMNNPDNEVNQPSKIRVILVDDHTLFREGLVEIIDKEPDMSVITAVDNGKDAVTQASKLKPDVMVIDIAMPSMNGIEVAGQIKTQNPEIGILILTAYPYGYYIRACIEREVDGFLLKTSRRNELVNAVRMIHGGKSIFDSLVTRDVLKAASKTVPNSQSGFLHERELEVIGLAAKGMSNKHIAAELGISSHTVATHFINIFRKLGVETRTEAVLHAFKAGLINL